MQILNGAACFRLLDTYGMPFDLLQEMLKERDMAFDWEGFCDEAAYANFPIQRVREFAEEHFSGIGEPCPAVLINSITDCYKKRHEVMAVELAQ